MNKKEDVDRIRQLLEQYKNGLTIDEVSKHLGINRSTASKYLNMLVSTGCRDNPETRACETLLPA